AYFKHVALQGEANTAVDLQLPLSHLADSQVNVATVLRSTQAKVTGIPAPFKSIAGKLIITEQGLSSPGFTGQWLGKPFTGKIINKDATRIYVSGQSAVDDLARVFNWPLDYLTGGTAWQAEVAVLPKTDTPLQLHIATQLKGVAVNLPAPFGKSKEAVSPLQVDLAIVDSRHARLDVYYAEAAARLVGRSPADTWQLDAGKLILGSGNDTKAFNDLPASGLAVNGALAQLDLGKWLSALELQPSPAQSSSVEAIPVDTRRYDSSDWPPAWLQSVDISIGLLKAFAQQIPDLQLTYRRQPGDAIIKLQSQPLAGSIVLPLQGDLPFRIDLARAWLTLPSGPEAEPTEAKSADSLKPTQIPAMAIRVQDLRIEDAMVGAVELSLKPIAAGLALEGLTIEGPEYTLNAQGSWTQSAQEQRTALTVEAHSTSVAETLRALGFAAAVTADSGSITSQVNWPGSPFGEILAVLDGRLHLRLEDGALREVEPGAGRLFGLLSLSALPRRLLLDFSDFFSEGLSFDTITGDFILVDGNAYTSNLTLVSPAADILVVGRIGLGAQDFDQLAIVNAHVSSALPVAGALAAGPQAGAIMLLLTQLLDEPLEKASRRKYHITGPWENPQVVPVDDEARDTP
ncbi:MAG TPA: AsmA-like C-terminal region-containing protein, partial [Gammaproteobacteria bacterium]|nr:AsmA-like C-terminal region-containing protein [Gammaproteobacteria bacterium]